MGEMTAHSRVTIARPTGTAAVPWGHSDEEGEWRRTMADFADREVAPGATERAISREFPLDLVPKLAKLGVFGLRVSESMGGSGAGLTSLCIALEEIARVDSSVAATVHTQAVTCSLLDHLAEPHQKKEILDAAIKGEQLVSFALTEPSGGSDAGDIASSAKRDGDDWILNGAKQFITSVGTPLSRYAIVFAATGPGRPGKPAVSSFLLPLDTEGVTVAPSYHKLGWTASETRPLFFEDVRLPGDALLGEQGTAFAKALGFLVWSRFPIAAIGTGLAQGCLDETLEFIADRESFGRRLSEHEAIAFDVAEMAASVAASRALTYDGCYRHDHDLPYAQQAAIAKLVTSELANKVAYRATQLHGGYGFIDETPVTRHYRDARILTIGEGTSEVQKLLIARSLGLPI